MQLLSAPMAPRGNQSRREQNDKTYFSSKLKALANEDTLLPTHCCRRKCFPDCPREQHLLRTQIKFCIRDTKNAFDFVQKQFVSATNVSRFAQPKTHHEQQCVRNDVSAFARAFIGHTQRRVLYTCTKFCILTNNFISFEVSSASSFVWM